jgi:hypothetical protein
VVAVLHSPAAGFARTQLASRRPRGPGRQRAALRQHPHRAGLRVRDGSLELHLIEDRTDSHRTSCLAPRSASHEPTGARRTAPDSGCRSCERSLSFTAERRSQSVDRAAGPTPGLGWLRRCTSTRRRALLCSARRRGSARAVCAGSVLRGAGDLEVLADEHVVRAAGADQWTAYEPLLSCSTRLTVPVYWVSATALALSPAALVGCGKTWRGLRSFDGNTSSLGSRAKELVGGGSEIPKRAPARLTAGKASRS